MDEVGEPKMGNGKIVIATHSHSYFSRVAEAELFERFALGELYRWNSPAAMDTEISLDVESR